MHNVVRDIASDKAPGPDGYIGAFFKASWQVIKFDLMAVINYFCSQHDRHFKQLNSAHMILIPKKMDALSLADYRPISLTHSVAKLVSKLLANRLAPYLNQIVSRAQSAFIKKQSIQDKSCLELLLQLQLQRRRRKPRSRCQHSLGLPVVRSSRHCQRLHSFRTHRQRFSQSHSRRTTGTTFRGRRRRGVPTSTVDAASSLSSHVFKC